jgi:hypothetical protein
MSTDRPRTLVRLESERAAEAYLRSLPPEHFREAVPQATQRKVTLESLDLAHAHRSDIQTFNELVVQYRYGRDEQIRHVVPDNMVVVHDEPIQGVGSFALELQPARPFWVLDYLSKYSERKDYEDSFRKYERELKVPYYLRFSADERELTLFRHTGRKYRTVPANEAGRYPIPELELELGLRDGWVRFWFRGELLPSPADLQRELEEARRQLLRTQEPGRRAQEQARQAEEQARRAREEAQRERQQKERLLAQLREMGIEPRL